jgi:hypothetical protein
MCSLLLELPLLCSCGSLVSLKDQRSLVPRWILSFSRHTFSTRIVHQNDISFVLVSQLLAILPLAIVHTMGNLFTNMSLGKVAVSFTHTIKAMEPFFSVLLSAIFLGEVISSVQLCSPLVTVDNMIKLFLLLLRQMNGFAVPYSLGCIVSCSHRWWRGIGISY